MVNEGKSKPPYVTPLLELSSVNISSYSEQETPYRSILASSSCWQLHCIKMGLNAVKGLLHMLPT